MQKIQDRTITIGGYTFDEKEHLHLLDGKPLTGVTTILKVIGKGDVLINWAVKCTTDYIDSCIVKCHYNLETKEGAIEFNDVFEKILTDARKAHTKKKEAAGDFGTKVHAQIEKVINEAIQYHDGIISSMVQYEVGEHDDEKVQKAVTNFIVWASTNKVKFLASEKHLYSREMWVGGICDIICEIDGKRYIGDVKTSSGIYPEYFYQTAAYGAMCKEMGLYDKFDGGVIINCKKDGTIDTKFSYTFDEDFKCFQASLTLYRNLESKKIN